MTAAAQHLLDARVSEASGGARADWHDVIPADTVAAYAIQDATIAVLGPIGGWKVGASGPDGQIHCAPLPASGLLASGSSLSGSQWRWRCLEVEAALRVAHDVDPQGRLLSQAELAECFDAVLPTMEVVESRYEDGQGSDPMSKLADLQCHGALVLGQPSSLNPADLDLRTLDASLAFDGINAAQTHGGNPAQDVWRMLSWLALHCAERGMPLRKGQIVTTGSCTGLIAAPWGALARGEVSGLGPVELRFVR